ncbi:MAG: undecaprenyl/decaprenyl-phosphate alpha-N-acetylglucosaminyl 1-phosphate transferase [Bacilli bacterium]|nr:undecaprenyl/decaprenyl-phosphate alpha-N-acetylglucosaminyl 1-phosphate transferase [Bacilli bacterium]
MNLLVNGYKIYEIVLVTFLTSFLSVPVVIKIAHHVNAIDYPNERKVHKSPMPRLGGVAIFGAFLVGYMLYAPMTTKMLSILISSFVMILLGIFDDINSIRARYKFIVQILAACIIVFYGQIFLSDISAFGLQFVIPSPLNYILTIFFIVSIINAINLIDGLDGLCSGISLIYFVTIFIIAFILNTLGGLDVILSLIMIGAIFGFLMFNFSPAKIFLGDSGSYFLGLIIAIIALLGFKGATLTSLIIPLIILIIPIFDTTLAIARRLLKHGNIGVADKEHFHHQLLKMKFSPRTTVLIIYLINILFAAVSIFYVLGDNRIALGIYVGLMLILLFIVLKTDILFEHTKKEKVEKPIKKNKTKKKK